MEERVAEGASIETAHRIYPETVYLIFQFNDLRAQFQIPVFDPGRHFIIAVLYPPENDIALLPAGGCKDLPWESLRVVGLAGSLCRVARACRVFIYTEKADETCPLRATAVSRCHKDMKPDHRPASSGT